jgi:hypothetical protein
VWTSENTIAFLATIATFIDRAWTLHDALIDFQCMRGMHSRANMAASLFQMLKKMDLVEKVIYRTCHYGRNTHTL